MRLPEALRAERDSFIYRSYVALGQHSVALDEIKDSADVPVALFGVKLLATYLSSDDGKEGAISALRGRLADPRYASNPTLQIIAATLFGHEDLLKDALQVIKLGTSLEHLALSAQFYLRMDRTDLAEKQLKAMQLLDDDCALTQLVCAWVNLHLGGSKLQEAAYTLQELIEKFGASPLLLNGLAAAQLAAGNAQDAEKTLIDAAGASPNDPNLLINMIACARALGKPEEFVARYVRQLRAVAPRHPWVQGLDAAESAFSRIQAQAQAVSSGLAQ